MIGKRTGEYAIPVAEKYPAVLSVKYILISFIAVFLTFFLHELSHWFMGEVLGYDMGMTINSAYPLAGKMDNLMHEHVISAAGPLFTVIQSMLFYFLLMKGSSVYVYPFLFTPLYMRLLAGIMNLFVLNDEGRISKDLGIGTYTLSIVICILIGSMVYHVSKMRELGKKFQLLNFFLTMVFTSMLILLNQYFGGLTLL